jgi:hypothetical protein
MSRRCVGCGGELEAGSVRASDRGRSDRGTEESYAADAGLAFARPGVPTAPGLLAAVLQGLREEPGDELLPIVALRCTGCGRLELYAPPRGAKENA